jgi:hypothetical protein
LPATAIHSGEASNGQTSRIVQEADQHRRFRPALRIGSYSACQNNPDVKKYAISTGPVGTPAGASDFISSALDFDSLDARRPDSRRQKGLPLRRISRI